MTRPGVSQVVFRDAAVLEQAHRLRAEYCVAVTGTVEVRPEGNANTEIPPTGEIEVNTTSLTVLGESAPLPFQLDETAGEEARLKYRYLDLRREGPPATQSGCAPRSMPQPAMCWPSTISSRSRPPRR